MTFPTLREPSVVRLNLGLSERELLVANLDNAYLRSEFGLGMKHQTLTSSSARSRPILPTYDSLLFAIKRMLS